MQGARWGKEKRADILTMVLTAAVREAADTALRMTEERKRTAKVYSWRLFRTAADLAKAREEEDSLLGEEGRRGVAPLLLFRRKASVEPLPAEEGGHPSLLRPEWEAEKAGYGPYSHLRDLSEASPPYPQETCLVLAGAPTVSDRSPDSAAALPPLQQQLDAAFDAWHAAAASDETGSAEETGDGAATVIQGSYEDFLRDNLLVQQPYREKLRGFCKKGAEIEAYLTLPS